MTRLRRLERITDAVLVGTSTIYMTTTTVVTAPDGGCLLVDPAVTPDDLADLRQDLDALGLRPVAAFATHPHWDHVLWSADLGDVPRHATTTTARAIVDGRSTAIRELEETAPGHDLSLFGVLTSLPEGAAALPWNGPRVDVVEHRAHAPGHAALHVVDDGVLVAGDMCSDIEIPLLDLDAPDPVGDYRAALDLLAAVAPVSRVVPGHGSVGDADELGRRLAADRHYLDELEAGRTADDPRLDEPWLMEEHRKQLRHLRP